MSGYFKYFPKTLYTFDKNTVNPQMVTNILARSSFLKEIIENSAVYYQYQLKEGDRPEIIADKLYGDPQRHWIILLFNKMMNPLYEFPLSQEALENYIVNKYGHSLDISKSTLHHYEQTTYKTIMYGGTAIEQSETTVYVNQYDVDYDTGNLSARTLPGTIDSTLTISNESVAIDSMTTVNIVTTVSSVSQYNYELTENENRRTLKLLDKAYVDRIENEFIKLMQDV